MTTLHSAAIEGNVEKLQELIDAGNDVFSELDDAGESPLHWACYEGHVECAELLLRAGADVDLPDSEGRTALHTSCAAGKFDVIKLLVQRGAKLERRDNTGWTPRDHAILQGFQDIAAFLMNELKTRLKKLGISEGLKQAEGELAELQHQLDEERALVSQLQSNQTDDTRVAQLQEQLQAQDVQIQSLQSQANRAVMADSVAQAFKKQVENLQEEMRTARAALDADAGGLQAANDKLVFLEQQLAERDEDILSLKAQCDAERAQVRELQELLEAASAAVQEAKRLKEDLAVTTASEADLRAQFEQREAEQRADFEQAMTTLQQKFQQLVVDRQQQTDALTAELEEQRGVTAELAEQVHTLNEALSQTQNQLVLAQAQCEQLTHQLQQQESSQDGAAASPSEVALLQQRVDDAQSTAESLRQELKKLTAAHKMLETINENSQQMAIQTADAHSDAMREVAQLKAELNQMAALQRRIARLVIGTAPFLGQLQELVDVCSLHPDASPAGDVSFGHSQLNAPQQQQQQQAVQQAAPVNPSGVPGLGDDNSVDSDSNDWGPP